jgi:hypothetical protein
VAAKAASREGSVFRCGANVIKVVVPVPESRQAMNYGGRYEGLRVRYDDENQRGHNKRDVNCTSCNS